MSFWIPRVKSTRCTNSTNLFILSNTVHISDGLFVHHQELKTLHTATGIFQTATAAFLLAGIRWNEWNDDGRTDRPKHEGYYSK